MKEGLSSGPGFIFNEQRRVQDKPDMSLTRMTRRLGRFLSLSHFEYINIKVKENCRKKTPRNVIYSKILYMVSACYNIVGGERRYLNCIYCVYLGFFFIQIGLHFPELKPFLGAGSNNILLM